jgi:hypothetical protein
MPRPPETPGDPILGPTFNPAFFTYKYIWRTRGENCQMCDALEGRVYIFDRWASAGVLPGFHLNCDCYLELVAIETPESDLDFFGDIFLYADRMFQFKWWLGMFTPYNWLFTEEICKFSQPGEPITEAFKRMKAQNRSGFFFRNGQYDIDFYQWRVFKTFRFFMDRWKSVYSINHRPRPRRPRVRAPWHNYNTYNVRNYKPGYRTMTIEELRKKYNPLPADYDRGWGR